jgi:hypothetical protein
MRMFREGSVAGPPGEYSEQLSLEVRVPIEAGTTGGLQARRDALVYFCVLGIAPPDSKHYSPVGVTSYFPAASWHFDMPSGVQR